MRLLLFTPALLAAVSEALSLLSLAPNQVNDSMLLAQTSQLDEMATEIAQTRTEMAESDKKHMGMEKYKIMKKVRNVFDQKNSNS